LSKNFEFTRTIYSNSAVNVRTIIGKECLFNLFLGVFSITRRILITRYPFLRENEEASFLMF
jgi:hypothetical protein